MKGIRVLLYLLIACAVLSGCSASTAKKPEDVQKFIMKLRAYQCDVVIAVTNNRSTNVYKAKHYYKAPDKYRIEMVEPEELKGQTTIYNKDKAYIYHPKIDTHLVTENFQDSMEHGSFIGTFVERFKDNGGARFKLEEVNGVPCYVLEIPLEDGGKYRTTEKIWIDAEKMLPIKAEILDYNNKVNAQVLYENFELNPQLPDSLFEIQNDK